MSEEVLHGFTCEFVHEGDTCKLVDVLVYGNVKLREFAHGLIDGHECGRGELCDGCTWDGMSDPREFNCKVRAEARELGVTADD